MKNILLVGNSLGFVSLIEKFRSVDKESAITLLSTDGCLPYDRYRLADFLSKEIKESQIAFHPESFYKTHQVKIISEQEIKSISFKRRHVTTVSKTQFDYDTLVLADTPHVKLPHIKGFQKQGLLGCVRLSQIKDIIKQIPLTETIIVTVNTPLGLKIAAALTRYKKEIKIITASKNVLSDFLDEESSAMLRQLLEQKGVQIFVKHSIAELLGDLEVKAVRLNSGKVISGEMVIFDDCKVDAKFFSEELVQETDMVNEKCFFKTQWPGVYVMDAVWDHFFVKSLNDYSQSPSVLTQQGRAIAADILGEAYTIAKVNPSFDFTMEGLNGFWMGKTQLEEGAREFLRFDAQKNIYKKIFAQDEFLIGGIFFNGFQEKEKIQQCIETQLNVEGVEDYILEEKFGLNQLVKLKEEKGTA